MPKPRREVPWLDIRDNGTYYAFWYDAARGRTCRRSLQTSDPAEATKRFGRFLIEGPARSGDDAGLTIAQALDDYLREHVDATDDKGRPLVADGERQRTIVRHLKAHFGADPISSIGPLESRAYVDARRKGDVGGGKRRKDKKGSDSTIRRELNCLVAAANHAVKWGRLPLNHMPRVELPTEERGAEVKWLTKGQLKMALDAAKGDLRDFILLAYYTAARRRSIETLTKFQVDLENSRINLMPPGARTTKKRKPVVPIYTEIRPTVERLMEREGEYLFGRGASFYRPFVELMADLGIDAWPHMLRHSRATHLLMDGEDIYKVARLLGDTVATVERVYGHSDPEFLAMKKETGQ